MSLIEFLRARLDEDEGSVTSGDCRCKFGLPRRPDCADRVLAEVDAKRRIVELAAEYIPELEHGDNGEWALDATLRLLALPYADHPDYDPTWTPT